MKNSHYHGVFITYIVCYNMLMFTSSGNSKMGSRVSGIVLGTALLMGIVAASGTFAANQVYRWVDEQGVVHFGDRVPEGVDATVVGIEPNTVTTMPSKTKLDVPPDPDAEAPQEEPLSAAAQRRADRAESRRKYSEEARKMQGNCEIMQRQKTFVESGPRVLVKGEDGNPRRLEDQERQDMLDEANAYLAANCD